MGILDNIGTPQFSLNDEEKKRLMGVVAQNKQEAQKPSMFQRFNQPQNWAALSNAFNTLRFQPDQGLAASNQKVIDYAQTTKAANKTVEYLRRVGRDDLAQAVEADPTVAADALKIATGVGGASTKSYAPVVREDGTMVIPTYDSVTGVASAQEIEGLTGETAAQKYEREMEAQNKQDDYERAIELGQGVFAQASTLDGQISKLSRIGELLDSGEADTGFLRNQLPAFDAATSELRALGNALGIDVINSATFGALSEAELRLALTTAIDLNLPPDELKKLVKSKIAAQRKLRDELLKKARNLTRSGASYSRHVDETYRDNVKNRRAPAGFDPDDWAGLTIDERIEFLELGQ
jgi:hypothetical protein